MPSGSPGPGELQVSWSCTAGSSWVVGTPGPDPAWRGAGTVLWVHSRLYSQWGAPFRGEGSGPP